MDDIMDEHGISIEMDIIPPTTKKQKRQHKIDGENKSTLKYSKATCQRNDSKLVAENVNINLDSKIQVAQYKH
jgi:hypothetical protein